MTPDTFEEIGLKFYDQAYAICDQLGIVKVAKRLTAKQRQVRRNRLCAHRKV